MSYLQKGTNIDQWSQASGLNTEFGLSWMNKGVLIDNAPVLYPLIFNSDKAFFNSAVDFSSSVAVSIKEYTGTVPDINSQYSPQQITNLSDVKISRIKSQVFSPQACVKSTSKEAIYMQKNFSSESVGNIMQDRYDAAYYRIGKGFDQVALLGIPGFDTEGVFTFSKVPIYIPPPGPGGSSKPIDNTGQYIIDAATQAIALNSLISPTAPSLDTLWVSQADYIALLKQLNTVSDSSVKTYMQKNLFKKIVVVYYLDNVGTDENPFSRMVLTSSQSVDDYFIYFGSSMIRHDRKEGLEPDSYYYPLSASLSAPFLAKPSNMIYIDFV